MEKQIKNGKTCQPDKTNQDKKTKERKPLEMARENNYKSVEQSNKYSKQCHSNKFEMK